MKPLQTYNYKGYSIAIHADENPMNPRTEFDNVSVFAFFHKRYDLGDKDPGVSDKDYGSWDEMEAAIRKKFDIAVMTPVYMYDHSWITIKSSPFSCPWDSGQIGFAWDSGQIGFAWITKQAARLNWGWKRITKKNLEQLEKTLEADLKIYDDFLTGSVYGYVIKDPDGNDVEDGSCWGYYGDDGCGEDSYAVQQARETIDHGIAALEKAKITKNENNPAQQKLGLETT